MLPKWTCWARQVEPVFFSKGKCKEVVRNSKERRAGFVTVKSVLFYHALLYKGSTFLFLSSKVSFPCLPGTHCLGLTDQSCHPSKSRITHHITTASHIHLLFRHTVLTALQHFRCCCTWSKALLRWVKIRFPLWLPAASPMPKLLRSLRFMSHPERASQLGQVMAALPILVIHLVLSERYPGLKPKLRKGERPSVQRCRGLRWLLWTHLEQGKAEQSVFSPCYRKAYPD